MHLTLWRLSENRARRQALSERAAALQRNPSGSPLDVLTIPDWQVFRKWCDSSSCDPRSASLGCIADFFISLFDKNLSLSSIRGYRSAIASVHKGFSNGSTVSNSLFLTCFLGLSALRDLLLDP